MAQVLPHQRGCHRFVNEHYNQDRWSIADLCLSNLDHVQIAVQAPVPEFELGQSKASTGGNNC